MCSYGEHPLTTLPGVIARSHDRRAGHERLSKKSARGVAGIGGEGGCCSEGLIEFRALSWNSRGSREEGESMHYIGANANFRRDCVLLLLLLLLSRGEMIFNGSVQLRNGRVYVCAKSDVGFTAFNFR